ncbi:MAG: helix-turn-helix transcriptional regulator [Synergistaceae bacterium]|nr:helix-turn-helix transcriptional regulator [Synergistaceae bacterium]
MPRWTNENRSPLGNIRANAGYSRETAANIMKLSLSTMVRYEAGSSDIPIGIAEEMAVLYQVPFDTIREAIKTTKEEKGINIMGHRSRSRNNNLNHQSE